METNVSDDVLKSTNIIKKQKTYKMNKMEKFEFLIKKFKIAYLANEKIKDKIVANKSNVNLIQNYQVLFSELLDTLSLYEIFQLNQIVGNYTESTEEIDNIIVNIYSAATSLLTEKQFKKTNEDFSNFKLFFI